MTRPTFSAPSEIDRFTEFLRELASVGIFIQLEPAYRYWRDGLSAGEVGLLRSPLAEGGGRR